MTPAPTKQQLVERSLERAADILGDITAPLMARYYAAHPAAADSFAHHGLGRRDLLEAEMVGNVLYCLMTWFERPEEIRIIFYDSVPHHADTLKVGADWYGGMLDTGIALIEETLPTDAADERAAWAEMRDGMAAAIARAQTL
ncbi:hypothetical protein [Sphingorhabdus sp.]|jgi:hypothetical protein|uniref:hypothetical protein n=1 Tax=Sphingorhabdus sp. TaxID=1902408 RepID=UPI003BAF75B8|nr:hypothetical protein [Sphingomonadales bacterium]MBK9432296.1 hypothetical protein [Sphingomonadales bacterium]MBL0022170.1 hypothetical protein [Sphingomonadales bacterium]